MKTPEGALPVLFTKEEADLIAVITEITQYQSGNALEWPVKIIAWMRANGLVAVHIDDLVAIKTRAWKMLPPEDAMKNYRQTKESEKKP